MAGKFTGLQKTYQIGDADGIALYTGVTYGNKDGYVVKPTADNAVFVGVVDNDERIDDPIRAGGDQTGRNIAVHVEGYGEIRIAGTVAYGDRLILGEGGVAKAMPNTSGIYNVIGFAEKSGVNGDVIPFKIAVMTVTIQTSDANT